MDESLPVTAQSADSGFSKGSLAFYVIITEVGTSVCDKNHSLAIKAQVVALEQWEDSALLT